MENKTLQEELKHYRMENAALRRCVTLQEQLDNLQYKYNNIKKEFERAVLCVDKIFQKDGILNGFLKIGDDEFEGCIKLAEKYKELCDLLKKNKIEEHFYNNHDKFLKLINYE